MRLHCKGRKESYVRSQRLLSTELPARDGLGAYINFLAHEFVMFVSMHSIIYLSKTITQD